GLFEGSRGDKLRCSGHGYRFRQTGFDRVSGIHLHDQYLYGTGAHAARGVHEGWVGLDLQAALDQPHFEKLNFGGFDIAVLVSGTPTPNGYDKASEVDLTFFDKINVLGGRIGVLYDKHDGALSRVSVDSGSYWHRWTNSVIADLEEHGAYINNAGGKQDWMLWHGVEFVRCASQDGIQNPCALYFAGNVSRLSNLTVIDTGHDFVADTYAAGSVDGVILAGTANTLSDSVIQGNSRGYGVRIRGNHNTVGPNVMFSNGGADAQGNPAGIDYVIEPQCVGNVVNLRPGQKCLDLSPAGANFVNVLGSTSKHGAPALLNGWVNFGLSLAPAGYVREGSTVRLRGTVKAGTINAPIFVLPDGYRPPANQLHLGVSAAGACQMSVNADGAVTANNGSNTDVSLNGVAFSILP
ncbi:MAG TPA: hypothetical protein VF576_05405, partial [Rubricoccaceae bacterium]